LRVHKKYHAGSNYLAIEFVSEFISLCGVLKGYARPIKKFMYYNEIAGISVDAYPFYLLISGSLACDNFSNNKRDFSEICIFFL
jgi:surface polysaccharide O-acyltransferase-like enzyme